MSLVIDTYFTYNHDELFFHSRICLKIRVPFFNTHGINRYVGNKIHPPPTRYFSLSRRVFMPVIFDCTLGYSSIEERVSDLKCGNDDYECLLEYYLKNVKQ